MITRRQIYIFLIVLSAGLMLGRIVAVNRTDTLLLQQSRTNTVNQLYNERSLQLIQSNAPAEELHELEQRRQQALNDERRELPVFSANDRSRWATIRVLVEPDMRVQRTIGLPDGTQRTETIWYAIDKAQNVRGWDTIDMVKHANVLESGALYSSKPPLLPTLMAIPYALLYHFSDGALSLAEHPHLVVRITLILFNLFPLIVCWVLLARLIDRFGITDWGRVFCVAFICFGTFLSTFAVTLNNHIPGMVSVTIAFYCVVRIIYDGDTRWRYYALAGFFSAFAVTCEKPALLFCCLMAAWLFWHSSRNRVNTVRVNTAPPALYDNPDYNTAPGNTLHDESGRRVVSRAARPARYGLIVFAVTALLVAAAHFGTNYIAHKTVMPAYSQQDWYFYEYERGGVLRDSYWKTPAGLDRGEECWKTYVFHATVGHHGVFLLTPVWILSFAGVGIWLFDRRYRTMTLLILFMSLTVFAFYMSLPVEQRNYGGNTSALRWMFWFAPLWSIVLVAAADRMSRTAVTRAVALLCLALSVMSASYPVWNPWTMPWAYNLFLR